MNSANLQLQGLLTVIAELIATLEARGVLDAAETAGLLERAERRAGTDAEARAGTTPVELEPCCSRSAC